jgi:antitoxin YefM
MKSTSLTHFRKNLAAMIDQAEADREPLLITREGGKPSAVLISLEDYASLEETRHLLASPKNARRLRESIAELEGGGGADRELDG